MDVRARDILGKIREIKDAEETVFAGGCVRNQDLGVKYNKVTMFSRKSATGKILDAVEKMGYPVKSRKMYQTYWSNISNYTYEFVHEGILVNLASVSPNKGQELVDTIMNDFDFGINKIWFDNSNIERTKEYYYDRDNKCLSLLNVKSTADFNHCLRRFMEIEKTLGGHWDFRCPFMKFDGLNEEKQPQKTKKLWVDPGVAGLNNIPFPVGNNFIPGQFIDNAQINNGVGQAPPVAPDGWNIEEEF